MAESALASNLAAGDSVATTPARHSALVRATHWIAALCFLALVVSGVEIVISHPRFYWGEDGNVLTEPLFTLPIPASRPYVETGYDFVLPDQNGWSRSLHFQSAWFVVFTGAVYFAWGVFSGHFRKNLLPAAADLQWPSLSKTIASHLRFEAPADTAAYNVLQRLAYSAVILVLFPVMIWTGLAMSPAVVSVFPAMVDILGGHQSARTLHFIVFAALILFLCVHVIMVYLAGFKNRVGAMISGKEDA